MKKYLAILLIMVLLLSNSAMAISDLANSIVGNMSFGKYLASGGWPEHYIEVCGYSEAEFLSALSEATEYAYDNGIISASEYAMYHDYLASPMIHGYLVNPDLGDDSASLYALCTLAVLATVGAILARRKRIIAC